MARQTVRPNPRGGYEVAGIPDANAGITSVGNDQVAGDRLGSGSAMAYRDSRFNDVVDNIHNHPYAMPSLNNNMWGPWLQRLKENNVHKLAADPYSVGGAPQRGRLGDPSFSFFGNPLTDSSSAPPPGYTTQGALGALRNGQAPWMSTPGGGPAQVLPSTDQFMQRALGGLRGYK